jgi:hypothetical protein
VQLRRQTTESLRETVCVRARARVPARVALLRIFDYAG